MHTQTTVVVKRQAEELGKCVPDKLRAQENLKLKTRARLNKRARKQKARRQSNQTTVKLKLSSQASALYSLRYTALDSREQRVARLWDRRPAPSPWPAS